jgi:hypothetical protein
VAHLENAIQYITVVAHTEITIQNNSCTNRDTLTTEDITVVAHTEINKDLLVLALHQLDLIP